MAQISTLKVSGDIGRSQITVNYSCSLEYDNPSYPPPGNNYTQETITSFSIEVNSTPQSSANKSGNLSCNYVVDEVIEKLTLTATLKYKYKTGKSEWTDSGSDRYESYSGGLSSSWDVYSTRPYSRKRTVYLGSWPDADDETVYYYEDQYQVVEIKWSSEEEKTISKTIDFYPAPPEFTFNNCSSGAKWRVDSGISSLITNINDFAKYATQWKKWKNQSSQGACPGFASGGKITAASLNSVHKYVETGKSYSQGAKVAADMFNSLATKINS